MEEAELKIAQEEVHYENAKKLKESVLENIGFLDMSLRESYETEDIDLSYIEILTYQVDEINKIMEEY